jgi:methionine synthase II (cobalamin-independent)
MRFGISIPQAVADGAFDPIGMHGVRHPFAADPEHGRDRRITRAALKVIPVQRLWVNADCGLKTRQVDEMTASLRNLVAAAALVRAESS